MNAIDETRADAAEAAALMAQAVELIEPVLELLELEGDPALARRARRLHELISESHEGLIELEEQL